MSSRAKRGTVKAQGALADDVLYGRQHTCRVQTGHRRQVP